MTRSRDRDLQRYFDGELGAREAQRARAELEESPPTQRQLAELRGMRKAVQDIAREETERASFDHLWTRIEAGLAAEQPPSLAEKLFAWVRRYGLVAASAAVAGVLALILLQSVGNQNGGNSCAIESIDVGPGVTSTIFTTDDADDKGETLVIWMTDDDSEDDST